MDIHTIIQMAKDHILKAGRHFPEIFVELDDKAMHILACPDITNSDVSIEKQHRFFTAGRILGEGNPGTNIVSIAFAVEAWVSSAKIDAPRPFARPSLDPNRKECLIVATLNVIVHGDEKHVEQHCHPVEMIRDGKGKLIDLLPWNLEEGKVQSPLLTSFLAGFVSTQFSKEQKDDFLAKMMGPDASGEEVREMSKKVYGRKMHVTSFDLSDIPSKQGKTSYRKTKKHNR
jgi:hypothetical protein